LIDKICCLKHFIEVDNFVSDFILVINLPPFEK